MKTIKSLKEITTLEVGDVVMFGNLEYKVSVLDDGYYLSLQNGKVSENNNKIFKVLNISKGDFTKSLGIDTLHDGSFPEVRSLEALTAIVSALFKEYEKQNGLPKTWEEFCVKYHLKEDEVYIGSTSELINVKESLERRVRLCREDRNICISKQEAEAHLALMQLRQLRKAYVKNWEPNWNSNELVHSVGYNYVLNKLVIESSSIWGNCMSFPTEKLATQFLTNFKDLLEIAKPLL